jgi:hypothetical protein
VLNVPLPRTRQPELVGTQEFAALKLNALRIFNRCIEA